MTITWTHELWFTCSYETVTQEFILYGSWIIYTLGPMDINNDQIIAEFLDKWRSVRSAPHTVLLIISMRMGSRVPHRLPVNQMLIVEYFFIIFHPGLISVVLPYLELNVNLLYSFKVNVNNSVSPLICWSVWFPSRLCSRPLTFCSLCYSS